MSRTSTPKDIALVAGFAAVCVAIMEFLAVNIGQPVPFTHAYTVHGVFSDADGIPAGADVRVSGVDVGKVTQVVADPRYPGESVVSLEIDDAAAVPVHTDGFARIRPKTLLGEKFVDLAVGSAAGEPIADGGFIPPAQAGKDVSNDEIFNAFDSATRQNQRAVLQALAAATQGRSADVHDILPQLESVVSNLDPLARVYEQDQPQVDRILVNLDTILRVTGDEHEQIADLFRNGNLALAAVAQRDQALETTLQEASSVAAELDNVVSSTTSEQRQAIDELSPTLSAQNALLDQVLGDHCFNDTRPCGVATVFTGTLLGNLNYPNDQLTVSSQPGELVTDEWDSMFSQPTADQRALNLVLAFHCDAVTTTVRNTLPSLYQDIETLLAHAQQQACP
jgi:phospholipid/cholesterol/gamma-HCH transport system substrate-binding protein